MTSLISLMKTVTEMIEKERFNQLEKWGDQQKEDLLWLGVLMEEIGEVSKELIENQSKTTEEYRNRVKTELIHATAVLHAWLEDFIRLD